MTLKQFITKFIDVGILDHIDIVIGDRIDLCCLSQPDWRNNLRDFLELWGELEIEHFTLTHRSCGNAMAMSFKLTT